jgi:hypothetical protein
MTIKLSIYLSLSDGAHWKDRSPGPETLNEIAQVSSISLSALVE